VIDMSVDTMKRLFELKNIAGVKGRHRQHGAGVAAAAAMGEDFNQMSGEDATHHRLHGAWRPWLHLGDLERRGEAVLGFQPPGRRAT